MNEMRVETWWNEICRGENGRTPEKNLSRLQTLQYCMYVYLRFQGASTSQVMGARNEMMMDDYDGQMIFGDLVGLKLPDIRFTSEEKPRKASLRKLVPTGDRTRARCVTTAYATVHYNIE